MADFQVSQVISRKGICEKLVSTDTTNYGNNDQGINYGNVIQKIWDFRDGTGKLIKTFTGTKDDYSCECDINLLTLNVTVTLTVQLISLGTVTVGTGFIIPCLGV